MAGFEKEMLEVIFEGLFQGHPSKMISQSSAIQAKGLTQFLLDTVDGRVDGDDITKPTTTGYGYINGFSRHTKEDVDLYFVKLSLITGKVTSDGDSQTKFRFQYLDLLVDKRLHAFAKNLVESGGEFLKKQLCKVTIANLHTIPEIYEGKPTLSTKGLLKGIEITA